MEIQGGFLLGAMSKIIVSVMKMSNGWGRDVLRYTPSIGLILGHVTDCATS
jgi:hypothetical protein